MSAPIDGPQRDGTVDAYERRSYPHRVDRHLLAEETSIRLHAEVARRLVDDPEILERARKRVRSWLETGQVAEPYARAWAAALDEPLEELCRLLVDESPSARALRQVTPFAGALDARERWKIWREVREEQRAAR